MDTKEPQMLEIASGPLRRQIAYLQQFGHDDGRPGLVWLCGFKSQMASTKASALARFACERRLSFVRFDYSGHGQSGGRFEDGTISRWLEETQTVFSTLTRGPQILIGSSMGGYIALLLLRALTTEASPIANRIKALVLIAPAWDMTERLMWKQFPESVRLELQTKGVHLELQTKGVHLRPSRYDDDPYPITRALIEDGRRHLIGEKSFDPGRRVYILHGLLDPDVPWQHTLDLEAYMTGGWIRVWQVSDGEHRLSRPQDLALLHEILDKAINETGR
jgi:pimeloyl-ACP methyl ester carboxylesterase